MQELVGIGGLVGVVKMWPDVMFVNVVALFYFLCVNVPC
jgi:hypothetical protein